MRIDYGPGFACISQSVAVRLLCCSLSLRGTDKHHDWPTLYDGFGKLTLGDLFKAVKSHKNVPLSKSQIGILIVSDLFNHSISQHPFPP